MFRDWFMQGCMPRLSHPHLVTLPFSPSLPSSRPSFGEIRFRGPGSALPGGRSNLLRIVFEDEDVKKSAQRIETLWLQASGRSCGAKINAARPHHDPPARLPYKSKSDKLYATPITGRVPGFHHWPGTRLRPTHTYSTTYAG